MWVIRFLSGPLTGKTLPLPMGRNTIGRSSQCSFPIMDKGVSKVHAELYVLEDKVIFTDLNSSNGSFINGIRIQSRKVEVGDKISIHNIIFDVHQVTAHYTAPYPPPQQQAAQTPVYQQAQAYQQAPPVLPNQPPPFADPMNMAGMPAAPGAAPHGAPPPDMGATAPTPHSPGIPRNFESLKAMFKHYVEDVALPGVYKLAELTEFKWVLIGFMLAFVLVITALSVVPMIQITKSSIEKESRRRALTIARNLAKSNESALLQGVESAVSVQQAQLEEGITTAMIISHVDGHIIAPIDQMGSYADKPFIHKARRENKESVEQIDDSTIGASVPIAFYNSQVGAYQVTAHAVILYNMGALAVDDGRTISLFVQTLAMALIIGAILFFFMYKLIEHPIIDINKQLDEALKEGRDNLTTKFQFPVLVTLCENLSSLLARALYGSAEESGMSHQADKDIEAENLLKIMGCPGMAINASNGMVISVNEMFEAVSEVSLGSLKEKGVEAIPDQAFQLNLNDLVERVQQQPTLIANNQLEIRGVNCALNAQAISHKGETQYIIITIQQVDESAEEAA